MDSVVFTPQDIRVLRMAARFLRARELQLPDTAHAKTHQGVLTSAMWLDHEADKLGAAPQTPSRETRRPIFNHLVAPLVGGPVYHAQAKAMLDAHESAVRAETLSEADERLAAMTLPEYLQGTFNAGTYSDAWRDCRKVVQDLAGGTGNAPRASADAVPALPCGCLVNKVCESCGECGHGCRCGEPPADDAHRCKLPPNRRLPCGCCPHEICEDCERCAHKCECGGAPAK